MSSGSKATKTSNASSAETLRVVFDSNVYIAAAFNPGKYADEWRKAGASGQFQVYSSAEILEEIRRKLIAKGVFSSAQASAFVENIAANVKLVRPTETLDVISADPDDNKILECAVEARANLIVTMDKHLLRLKQFRGIGIAHTRDLKYLFLL